MADQESKIVAATGIAVRGNSPESKEKELAMRLAAMNAHEAGHDDERIAFAVEKARSGK